MQFKRTLEIKADHKLMVINVADILYIKASVNDCYIHVTSGSVYKTRSTLEAMEAQVGEYFLKVHRTYLVCIMAIHALEDTLTLINGEELNYATRRKKEILAQLQEKQKKLIEGFAMPNTPKTPEEYHAFYRSFDQMPFAFTDIEMVFNEDGHAVDWIFRYGNEKLAEVEHVPLTGLIGNIFGSIFSNMDDKWLCTYERATLYGEQLEIMAYSPEFASFACLEVCRYMRQNIMGIFNTKIMEKTHQFMRIMEATKRLPFLPISTTRQ